MRETKIINLYGAPGAGKSTIASSLFSILKWNKINCELVTEYAKDLVWSESYKTLENQLYVFAHQHNRIFRLLGKVDYIITDSPILLSGFYAQIHNFNNPYFHDMILHEYNKNNNINIFLKRVKDYDPNGRLQTEEESIEYANIIREYLENNDMFLHHFDALETTAMDIYEQIIMSE